LRELIPLAYDIRPFQLVGPDWLGAQRFDIVATLSAGATQEQVPHMLQALLTERFKLTAHLPEGATWKATEPEKTDGPARGSWG